MTDQLNFKEIVFRQKYRSFNALSKENPKEIENYIISISHPALSARAEKIGLKLCLNTILSNNTNFFANNLGFFKTMRKTFLRAFLLRENLNISSQLPDNLPALFYSNLYSTDGSFHIGNSTK